MKIGHIVNKIPLVKQNKETPKLVDSTTLLGVEVEVEKWKEYDLSHIYSGYWTAKKDDSLRNNGMEMVFAEPLSGADAVSAVEWLCEQAVKHKWAVSKLTGLHVHVDIRNLELDQFRNFCAVYALTEPLIYYWVGRNRFENMFCLPWYMAETDLKNISKVAKEGEADPARARAFLESLSKYSGCNLNAVHKFGTAEFRMLETTFDAQRIIDWINILLSLKKYAMLPGLTPQTMCENIKVYGAWAFGQAVFGLSALTQMWYKEYEQDVIGQGMVTCDWFLDNTRDLKLKGRPPGEILNWARVSNLTGDKKTSNQEGEHKGLANFKKRRTTLSEPEVTKKPTKKYGTSEFHNTYFIYENGAGQLSANQAVEPAGSWGVVDSQDDSYSLDP